MNKKLISGSIESMILQLFQQQQEWYGYEISKKIAELTQNDIILKEGALYPALHRLESKGILESTTRKVDQRYRKYYTLTQSGQLESQSILNEMQSYILSLQRIFPPLPT